MSRFAEPLPVLAEGQAPLYVNVPQLLLGLHIDPGAGPEAERAAVESWLRSHVPTPALRRSIERAGWGDLLNPAA